jgi:hypothetical protein
LSRPLFSLWEEPTAIIEEEEEDEVAKKKLNGAQCSYCLKTTKQTGKIIWLFHLVGDKDEKSECCSKLSCYRVLF